MSPPARAEGWSPSWLAAPLCKVRGQPRDRLGTPGFGAGVQSSGACFSKERRTLGPGSAALIPAKRGHLFQEQQDIAFSAARVSGFRDPDHRVEALGSICAAG